MSFEVSERMSERPGRKMDAQDFPLEVRGGDFQNWRIEWCRAKNVVFIECDFSSSLIKNCYFHRAAFKGCNFIGATIVDSNFRGGSFSECNFECATFRSTLIDAKALLRNLPAWENARRELLRGLRKNAESIGDVEDVRLFLAAEMDASEEHWRSAFKQVQGYYVNHYSGYRKRFIALARLLSVKAGRFFWGHGDSPLKLLRSFLIWCSGVALVTVYPTTFSNYLASMEVVCSLALGVPGVSHGLPNWVVIILVSSRYLFLGLFATVFVRRFARR